MAEALAEHRSSGDVVVEIFLTSAGNDRVPALVADATELNLPCRLVSEAVLAAVAETVNPQGIVAVCRAQEYRLDDVLQLGPRLVVVLAGVSDPGNAGTIIRTADAAGADAVIIAGASVDPRGGKCVRASAGSVFHLPVVTQVDLAAVADALRGAGLTLLAADPHAERALPDAADLLGAPTAWVFGNEVRGLGGPGSHLVDATVRVSMYGRAESLNLAAAAAVCLFASAQAHRETDAPPR